MVNKESKGMRQQQGAPPEDFVPCMQGWSKERKRCGKHQGKISNASLILQQYSRDGCKFGAGEGEGRGEGRTHGTGQRTGLGVCDKRGLRTMGTPREGTGGRHCLAAPSLPQEHRLNAAHLHKLHINKQIYT